MASSDQSRKEGRRGLLGSEGFVSLVLALAGGHVHHRFPEDEEDVLYDGKIVSIPIAPIFLGLVLLHGDTAVIFLKHVTLLKGVVD
jgi:hypothetical protein